MDIASFYNPAWDKARDDSPERTYEDDDVILASNFECGNGHRFRRLENGRYALEVEVEPGGHIFSGYGCYFCFAALNKRKAREVIIEVTAVDGYWEGDQDEIDKWVVEHPGEYPPSSFARQQTYVIVKRDNDWSLLPRERILKGRDRHTIAFSCELPAVDEDRPVLYFSNYHWYPQSEMAAYLKGLAREHACLTVHSLCKSVQGRDVLAAEIGGRSDDVPVIVCASTPQPNEMGNWACRAILDFLLSDDERAREIVRRHRVCFVPHPNPDGTVHGYIASDALGKFVFFLGRKTFEGDPAAPQEQVALWEYLKERQPWLFIEWHSNHHDRRKGHVLLLYDPALATDPDAKKIWRAWHKRLYALPDIDPEGCRLTNRTTYYADSLGLGVAAELGGIPAMIKVHDKYPFEQILDYVICCFCAATEVYAECVDG